jgi:hypothetical protein
MNKERLNKVAVSIWMSKVRYGVQLHLQVRNNDCLDKLQKVQKKMLRTLESVKLCDKISIKSVEKPKKLSNLMWKVSNLSKYPLKIKILVIPKNGIATRGMTQANLLKVSNRGMCIGNATRIWNKAPTVIKTAKSIGLVKKEICKYCATLPI